MPEWLERLSGRLPERFRKLLAGKPPAQRMAELVDEDDPRSALRPLDDLDWLCPFCAERLVVPAWDGSPMTLLEQTDIFGHLLQCPVASQQEPKPEMKPWDDLMEAIVRLRIAQWPNYKIANASGDWICPHCLKNTGVILKNWDGSPAPLEWFLPDAIKHLKGCSEYAATPLNPKTDLEVRSVLGAVDVRQMLSNRVASDPIFRVSDDSGAWIDPFSDRAIENINLLRTPWGPAVQRAILDYLISPACPGARTNWRTDRTVEHLSRVAGMISAQRNAPEPQISAEAEAELQFLRKEVESAQEMKKELVAARAVQLKMLPDKPPKIEGYEVSAFYQPCVELGGDLFHFLEAGPGRTAFLVGDVSGHGVDAAMIMSMTMKSFTLRGKGQPGARGVLAAVNHDLHGDLPRGRFVSAFYAVLDHASGVFLCARAGHNPAYLVDPKAGVQALEGKGPALGIVPAQIFETKVEEYPAEIPHGGVLLLYTDGIPEAHNPGNEQFGDERLKATLEQNAGQPSRRIVEAVIAAVRTHVAGRPIDDDLTLIAIKRLY